MSFSQDRDALLRLGELLKAETGISLGGLRPELVQARLSRRMHVLGVQNLADYVGQLERGRKEEVQFFINLMTTNHTYFFREKPHLDFLASVYLPRLVETAPKNLLIWCAACSTGEEVYTVAMLVHRYLARRRISLEVSILGTDINTEALRIAANGVYPVRRLQSVPTDFKRDYFQQGKFPHDKYFRVADDLRKMVRFSPGNLLANVKVFQSFDLILCRNVMIYFEQSTTRQVVKLLRGALKDDGILISGLSERIDHLDPRLVLLGRSVHAAQPESRYRHNAWECQTLEQALVSAGGASARTPGENSIAPQNDPAAKLAVDLGQSLASERAMQLFGDDELRSLPAPRPAGSTAASVGTAARMNPSRGEAKSLVPSSASDLGASRTSTSSSMAGQLAVVAIGASTGGQEAVGQVLTDFSSPFPPVVIAQHIAAGYSRGYVETMRRLTTLTVKEAQDGEVLQQNTVYVAPGGHHLTVIRRRGAASLIASVRPDDGSKLFVPSVDLLFQSLAELDRVDVLAAILTGMGDDGTAGARALAAKGCRVLAQDRATSTVYGMPGSAVAAGVVAMELPLRAIGGVLASRARQMLARKGAA